MESCQTHRDGKATAAARREAARAHCRRATCRAAQSTTRAVLLSCSVRLLYLRMLSKTEDTSLPLPSVAFPVTPGNAFSQSTINCPGGHRTCTARVEISSQFGDLTAGDVVVIGVSVDGSQNDVKPSPTVAVHDTPSTG